MKPVVSRAGASLFCQEIEGKSPVDLRALTPEKVLSLLNVPVSPGRRRCAHAVGLSLNGRVCL
jgi:hypothetical protein